MSRRRISIVKEDRVWALRSQGYDYDSIARIANVHPSLTQVIRRIRQRPPIEEDPIRRGRRAGWMSDAQLEDIRTRRQAGETLQSIARSYWVDANTIWSIVHGRTYKEPESSYPWSFQNRMVKPQDIESKQQQPRAA